MGQETTMIQSFVLVTTCALAVVIGIYLRALLDARKLRRMASPDAARLALIQNALPMVRGLLWILASVIGVALIVFRNHLFV